MSVIVAVPSTETLHTDHTHETANSWQVDTERGYLRILAGHELLAQYAPGAWLHVRKGPAPDDGRPAEPAPAQPAPAQPPNHPGCRCTIPAAEPAAGAALPSITWTAPGGYVLQFNATAAQQPVTPAAPLFDAAGAQPIQHVIQVDGRAIHDELARLARRGWPGRWVL